MKPRFFRTAADLRRWFEKNGGRTDELWIGFYKKGSGRTGATYPEAVDAALCFGWIDGIAKPIDDASYMQRFTPRRRGSGWSEINIRKVAALKRARLMTDAGLAAFAARRSSRASRSAHEQRKDPKLTPAELTAFRAAPAAWDGFLRFPPGYRRLVTWWVVSAMKPETRARRLATLMADSARGWKVKGLRKRGDPGFGQ